MTELTDTVAAGGRSDRRPPLTSSVVRPIAAALIATLLAATGAFAQDRPVEEGRRAFETRFIQHVLEGTEGRLGEAADQLGIHRNTLTRKIEEYRIRVK